MQLQIGLGGAAHAALLAPADRLPHPSRKCSRKQ
jgi:hypothetical protein